MITPRGDVVSHDVHVHGGVVKALVTSRGHSAMVYGNTALTEVTLVVLGRCPYANDVLGGRSCRCAEHVARALDVVRRAPLGLLVYLNSPFESDVDATVEGYADVALFLSCLTDVRRVYLPLVNVAEVGLLRQVLDAQLVHAPTLLPTESNNTWPAPERPPLARFRRSVVDLFWRATLWVENLVRRPR